MAKAHALLGQAAALGANTMVGLRQRLRKRGGDHLRAGLGMRLHLDARHLELVDAGRAHQDVPGGGRLARSARTRAFRTFAHDRTFDVRAGLEVFGGLQASGEGGARLGPVALRLLALLIAALRLRVLRMVTTLALALFVVVSILGHRGHSSLRV